MATTPAAPAAPSITVTLGAFVLPAFTLPLTIDGVTVNVPVAAGIKIPAGVTGTFVMPTAAITFTADSPTTADASGANA